MQWAATKKEVERSNFFKEIPKIAKRFWFPLLLSFALIAGMAVLSTRVVPLEWRVTGEGWAVILPLAYVLSFCSIHRLLLIDIQFDLWMPYSLPCTFGFLALMGFRLTSFWVLIDRAESVVDGVLVLNAFSLSTLLAFLSRCYLYTIFSWDTRIHDVAAALLLIQLSRTTCFPVLFI